MNQTHSKTESPTLPEFVYNGRKTTILDSSISQSYKWHKYHGILITIPFTMMVPSAIVYLRSGMPKAFTVHWMIQVSAAMIAFSSAAFTIVKSWDSYEIRPQTTLSQHLTRGSLITIFLAVQPVLGYYHHVYYVKFQRTTLFSHLHIWVGRALIVLAWVNTGLGLKLAHTGSTSTVYWLMVGMVALAMVWAPKTSTGMNKMRKKSEEAVYKPLDPGT